MLIGDSTMRVAFLVHIFPALSETFVLDQITGLLERGCEVDIYANIYAPNTLVHPDVVKYNLLSRLYAPPNPDQILNWLWSAAKHLCHHLPTNPRPLLHALNGLKYGSRALTLRLLHETVTCLDQEPYDIIHAHFGPTGMKGIMLRSLGVLSGKLVTTFYGYDVSRHLRESWHGSNCYRELFATGDLFIAISEKMRHRLLQIGCPPQKIIRHHLGVDCQAFTHSVGAIPSDCPPSRVNILSIARLVPKKGLEYGIRAVARLALRAAARDCPTPIQYTIIGDGDLRPQLQQLINQLNVAQLITLQGWQSRPAIINALAQADILLAPSVTSPSGDEEGTPVALMEAMAMGLPVVSTEHSGIPEVVTHRLSGLLAPERDVETLSNHLKELIHDPAKRLRLGQAGRAHIESHHNIVKLNDQLVTIYQKLLAVGSRE
jgi:colanic acid/amylovoran biosynthesis glycosyltransferase